MLHAANHLRTTATGLPLDTDGVGIPDSMGDVNGVKQDRWHGRGRDDQDVRQSERMVDRVEVRGENDMTVCRLPVRRHRQPEAKPGGRRRERCRKSDDLHGQCAEPMIMEPNRQRGRDAAQSRRFFLIIGMTVFPPAMENVEAMGSEKNGPSTTFYPDS